MTIILQDPVRASARDELDPDVAFLAVNDFSLGKKSSASTVTTFVGDCGDHARIAWVRPSFVNAGMIGKKETAARPGDSSA